MNRWMTGGMYIHRLFAKILAAPLQTLAEKMSNTIYRAAKVCSYQSVDTDKITDISWQDIFIISSFCLSNV